MKAATVILALAALASATPRPNPDAGVAAFLPRQECIYAVLCQDDKEGDDPDPDTAKCCTQVGGTLGEGGFRCEGLIFAKGEDMARCCGRSGGYAFFTSGKSCPPIVV